MASSISELFFRTYSPLTRPWITADTLTQLLMIVISRKKKRETSFTSAFQHLDAVCKHIAQLKSTLRVLLPISSVSMSNRRQLFGIKGVQSNIKHAASQLLTVVGMWGTVQRSIRWDHNVCDGPTQTGQEVLLALLVVSPLDKNGLQASAQQTGTWKKHSRQMK